MRAQLSKASAKADALNLDGELVGFAEAEAEAEDDDDEEEDEDDGGNDEGLEEEEEEEQEGIVDEHDDVCNHCSLGGLLLLCDTCTRCYHYSCLGDRYTQDERKEEFGDGVPFYCEECERDEFVDDSEDTPENLELVKRVFTGVHRSLQQDNEVAADPAASALASAEMPCNRSIKNLCMDQDPDFERITRELDQKRAFVSKSLSAAEGLLLREFSEKEEQRKKLKAESAAAAARPVAAEPAVAPAPVEPADENSQ